VVTFRDALIAFGDRELTCGQAVLLDDVNPPTRFDGWAQAP
jgi:hypothetical protein